ncbi:MAG: NADH-quinone oxidoreductase subunit J [Planctomycetes bacterium]|nr:NADH-quinone oxidoreductase subunit J [Planctomycetota bacterium]
MTAADLSFLAAAAAMVGGAALAVTRRSAVYAALSVVVSFMGVGVAYFLLAAEFLGIAQVFIYAGAIIVLFLFVIMLLDLRRGVPDLVRGNDRPFHLPALLLALAVFLLAALPATVCPGEWPPLAPDDGFGSTGGLGRAVYSGHTLAFEVVGLVLLAAVVGSVAVAGARPPREAPPGGA